MGFVICGELTLDHIPPVTAESGKTGSGGVLFKTKNLMQTTLKPKVAKVKGHKVVTGVGAGLELGEPLLYEPSSLD